MRRFGCITALFALSVAGSLHAQTADRTTGGLIRRTPESAEQQSRAERKVTVDLQVTDKSGKPVTGLQQPNFTLLDSGHPVPITSFREFDGRTAQPPTEIILVVDVMNASFQDVVLERQGIEAFLRQNGGQLALPVSIVFLSDTGTKVNKPSQDGNSLAQDLKNLQTPMRVLDPAQGAGGAQDRSQRSLRALLSLSTYEATKPGRKLLIWVGPGWPLLSRLTAELSAQDQSRYFHSIVDMTTDLRRAHITVYSVAPLNLAQVGGQNPFLYQTYLKGVENPTQADSPNLALQVLAVHSGGLVLNGSGDLAKEIALCVSDAQSYYEITFDAAESDTLQYHPLQVKSGQPGIVTRTSTSYYAGIPQSTSEELPNTTAISSAAPAPHAIRAETRLVIVDATVLDKKGQPVKDLLPSDFLLREDNAPQKIVSLEQHTPIPPQTDAVPDAAPNAAKDGALIVSNKLPPGSIWNVVLIDLYNTAKEDRGRLQSQLEQFLKQLPEHEPVALVTMLTHIKIETSFQDGAAAAYRYLHKNGLGPIDGSTPANMVGSPGQEVLMPSANLTGTTVNNQANVDVDHQANRAQTTLDCFSALAQWLASYPGRKNVYWLSGGFPLEGKQFGVVGYGIGLGAETKGNHPLPMQQKTDTELEKARVAIYPVDVRGVAATNADGVTNADSTYVGPAGTPFALDDDLSAARRQEMLEIAKATGGTAQFNNNIAQALRNDFDQANTYYTIAYEPPDKEGSGAYHRIQLSVDKPEVQLVYRAGYYAKAETVSKPTPEQFKSALQLNAPSGLAVQFASKITRAGDQVTAEYGVEPTSVDYEADAAGQFLTDIEFAILEYDAKGKLLDKSLVRLSGKMTPQQRAKLTAKTLTAKQTIALKPGAKTLVLGVRDKVSGRFGTVEAALPAH